MVFQSSVSLFEKSGQCLLSGDCNFRAKTFTAVFFMELKQLFVGWSYYSRNNTSAISLVKEDRYHYNAEIPVCSRPLF